jgi:hypothetical protein
VDEDDDVSVDGVGEEEASLALTARLRVVVLIVGFEEFELIELVVP